MLYIELLSFPLITSDLNYL